MSKIAVVTGAGSGVGKAVATLLSQNGWKVALIARRKETLDPKLGLPCPCDICDEKQVAATAQLVQEKLGTPTVLVNAAGTNIPKRSLAELSIADFRKLIDTNLTGSFLCIHAFLPGMRKAGSGTIVNIGSDAGHQASPKSGGGYAASKFGLRGLTQSVNAEERGNGIRACYMAPGDIDTPLLENRPVPPNADARKKMLQPDDIARCTMLVIDLPSRVIVEDFFVKPA